MKKVVTLVRHDSSLEGTFGKITVDDLTLFTGELPWINNEQDISCIPEGEYDCQWTYSPRFKRYMYLVFPVDGRLGIRIHSANLMGDRFTGFKCQLNGCIAMGEKLGWLDGQKALLVSKPAIRRFENYLNKENFRLEIINGFD